MNLSKKSWHYKIYRNFFGDDPPKTLCDYMFSLSGPLLLLLSAILVIMYIVFLPFISFVIWMGLNIVIFILMKLLYKKWENSLLYKWLKAIKEKNCPIITWKDEAE